MKWNFADSAHTYVWTEHGEIELKAFKIKDFKEWKEKFEEKNPKGVDSNVCPFCGEVRTIFIILKTDLQPYGFEWKRVLNTLSLW